VEAKDTFSEKGYLIVSASKYPTFEMAKIYAKEVLHDSLITGEKQWFLWRGGFFNTEAD